MSDGSQPSQLLEKVWDERTQAILEAIEAGETISSAAAKGELTYAGLYKRRKKDAELNAAVEAASAKGRKFIGDKLAKVLYAGAEKAEDDPRFTTQLIFALKNLDPVNFRDAHEVNMNQTGDLAARLLNMNPAAAYAMGAVLGKSHDEIDSLLGSSDGGDDG